MKTFDFDKDHPLLLVGAGNMGSAMAKGWLAHGLAHDALVMVDPAFQANAHPELAGVECVATPANLPSNFKAKAIVLAVKPQMMDAVLPSLATFVSPDSLILSIAAGTSLKTFEGFFVGCPIVRAMPNTPAAIGMGISAIVANAQCKEVDKAMAEALMTATGSVIWLQNEDQINAVTGTSGSGPAYVFYMVESLAAAAVANGLEEDVAMQLARQTVIGAAHLMEQDDGPVRTLRKNVTSPNGTTSAALDVLMAENGLQRLMRQAVTAARKRAEELSE